MPQWEPYSLEAPYAMVFKDNADFTRTQPNDLMKFLVKDYFKKK